MIRNLTALKFEDAISIARKYISCVVNNVFRTSIYYNENWENMADYTGTIVKKRMVYINDNVEVDIRQRYPLITQHPTGAGWSGFSGISGFSGTSWRTEPQFTGATTWR